MVEELLCTEHHSLIANIYMFIKTTTAPKTMNYLSFDIGRIVLSTLTSKMAESSGTMVWLTVGVSQPKISMPGQTGDGQLNWGCQLLLWLADLQKVGTPAPQQLEQFLQSTYVSKERKKIMLEKIRQLSVSSISAFTQKPSSLTTEIEVYLLSEFEMYQSKLSAYYLPEGVKLEYVLNI